MSSRQHTLRRAISKIMAYDSLPESEKWGEELIEWLDRLKQHLTPINMRLVVPPPWPSLEPIKSHQG